MSLGGLGYVSDELQPGVHRVRSIRRLPDGETYKEELYNHFKSTPWNPKNDGRFYPQFILPYTQVRRTSTPQPPPDTDQQQEDQVPDYNPQPEASEPQDAGQQATSSPQQQEEAQP